MDVLYLFTLFLLTSLLRDPQSVRFAHTGSHIILPWNKGYIFKQKCCHNQHMITKFIAYTIITSPGSCQPDETLKQSLDGAAKVLSWK